MSESEVAGEVRQQDWTLEMVFRWLEESAAFLHEIETHRRPQQPTAPDRSTAGAGQGGSDDARCAVQERNKARPSLGG
jgi:hypothetical protein